MRTTETAVRCFYCLFNVTQNTGDAYYTLTEGQNALSDMYKRRFGLCVYSEITAVISGFGF